MWMNLKNSRSGARLKYVSAYTPGIGKKKKNVPSVPIKPNVPIYRPRLKKLYGLQ